jgi:hypothetical protein
MRLETEIEDDIHTPMRTRSKDTISIITDGVDDVLDSINRSRREDNMLRLDDMDRIEVCIEEAG